MAEATDIERALTEAARDLTAAGKRFALVGGLAVSVRSEVRFTRDVDLAVVVTNDDDATTLVYSLRNLSYVPAASVEHDTLGRLATVRLVSPSGIKVDLLFASSGIEAETVERASSVAMPVVGVIPVAHAEELLAMKVLSMTDRRLQDRLDAQNLLIHNVDLDLGRVRADLQLIRDRGFHRDQDLEAKLQSVLASR